MKKYFISLFIIIYTFIALPVYALTPAGSGFIPGQIWYSKETLVEGETVNIHTAVWNGENNSIGAKVEFYDKNVILGTRDITVLSLELKDVFIPWKVTSGDHVISAKITSSTILVSGKKEKVVLDNVATSNDKQSISVLVKDEKGNPVLGTDKLKTQLEDTGSKINDILPEKVSSSISSGFNFVENFRNNTSVKITETKDETQKEIDQMKSEDKTILETVATKNNIEDATKKPITYIKLYLFSVLAFIFTNKIVFYGLLILITYYILRSIYSRIRNR